MLCEIEPTRSKHLLNKKPSPVQNHRKYVQSKSAKQLSGDIIKGLDEDPPPLVRKEMMNTPA